MLLNNPATYLSVAAFQAEANDYDLSTYTSTQLQDILVAASSTADSIMRRSYQPQEVTEQIYGNGTNTLNLANVPIAYVKSAELVMPGFAPFQLPLGELFYDYQRGTIQSFSPLIFQSFGVANVFPSGLPIVVNYAYGWGWPIPAPAFTLSAGLAGTLTPGQAYDFQVTTRTQSGESLPSTLQTFTCGASGAIAVGISPQPGAFVYRIYGCEHGATPVLITESPATNYGQAVLTVPITSLSPPATLGALPLPTVDNSAWPQPAAANEAVRLLALMRIYEQNDLSNRGIYKTQSGRKSVMWRSTQGMSDKGLPLLYNRATELLKPYSYQGIL